MDEKTHDGVPAFVPGTLIGIRHISSAQLESLGVDEVAFIKPMMTGNGEAYAIHAADGSPMAIASNVPLAIAAIIQNEMLPKFVH